MWPAVEEFLAAHPNEWALQQRFTNNNGLTVLKRTGTSRAYSSAASEPSSRIAFITAITDDYELTLKLPVPQTIPADFIVYSDNPDLDTYGKWKLVDANQYRLGIDDSDRGNELNSLSRNTHSFNRAKFFKVNLHRLPELKKYDAVIWIDGSVEITHPYTAEDMLTLVDSGFNIIVNEHANEVIEEVTKSLNVGRYATHFWRGQNQTFQDVEAQYAHYVQEGFQTRWFDSADPKALKLWPKWGLSKLPTTNNYITCFVVFDMRKQESKSFLSSWRHEVLTRSTQDQISFPFVLYKLGYLAHSFEWPTYPRHEYFTKHMHGI